MSCVKGHYEDTMYSVRKRTPEYAYQQSSYGPEQPSSWHCFPSKHKKLSVTA